MRRVLLILENNLVVVQVKSLSSCRRCFLTWTGALCSLSVPLVLFFSVPMRVLVFGKHCNKAVSLYDQST